MAIWKSDECKNYCCFVLCLLTADCIANYGNHAENTQHSSETAIYSDVNLSNKLSEIKMFPNSNMCYTSPDGDSSATYEPIPYATTQLIQANIKNKAAAAIAEPLDIPCWKQQPPNLPPIPKEMAVQMQYNITEQNMLIKGNLGFHLEWVEKRNTIHLKKNWLVSASADNLQGSEGAIHPKIVPYNHNHDHNTGSSYHSSDRGSNSTAGNSSRPSSLEQIHTAQDGPDVFSSLTRESKSKEGSSGPQNPQT